MSKPISWANRVYEIRNRVQQSKLQTWRRQDLEAVFEIKRASAQNLMKTIGGVETIGATHFVEKTSLMTFLEEAVAADKVAEVVTGRRALEEPPPMRQRFNAQKVTLPDNFRSIMVRDLPDSIQLGPGSLTITGAGTIGVIEGLYLMAQVLTNDLETVRAALDPPRETPPQITDDELAGLFDQLRRDEAAWSVRKAL